MNGWGQLDAKIAHEESVALATKIAAEKEAEGRKAALKKDLQKSTKSISENESAKNWGKFKLRSIWNSLNKVKTILTSF